MTPTLSGSTPRGVTRFRPPAWIVAVSPNESTCQSLQFSFGVHAVHEDQRPKNWELYAREWMQDNLPTGEIVVLTQGTGTAGVGGTNKIEIIELNQPPAEPAVW
jgi:pyruvate kinase